jgi:hypothetical protein
MIWLVEILEGIGWIPCSSPHFTRTEAKEEVVYVWKPNNPNMKFRVRKYVPG